MKRGMRPQLADVALCPREGQEATEDRLIKIAWGIDIGRAVIRRSAPLDRMARMDALADVSATAAFPNWATDDTP
jgi:hypothetical protein